MTDDAQKRKATWRRHGADIVVCAVLALLLANVFIAHLLRRPAGVTVAQVHEVSYEAVDDRVNINTADASALMTLSGIGEVLAERILEYRGEHGAFESAEELIFVDGIGEKKLAAILPEIKTE